VRAITGYLAALRAGPARPIVAAMGEASSAAAREAGFPPDVVATEPSVGAFVQSVTRYVMSKGEG
jgi:uroporphyrinogen-III synthase